MGRFVRREFLGSRLLFFLLVISGIGIPFAIIYLIECTVSIEEEVKNPEELVASLRARRS